MLPYLVMMVVLLASGLQCNIHVLAGTKVFGCFKVIMNKLCILIYKSHKKFSEGKQTNVGMV